MKKVILVLMILGIGLTVKAQKNIPKEVQNNFNKMFANAEKVKYSKEKDGSWEVDFKQNHIKHSAKFTAIGDWLETEEAIKESALPQQIKAMLVKDYQGWDIEDCEKVQTPDKATFYEIFVEKGKENLELKIDESGKVFEKNTAKKSESDDEDDKK